MAAARASAEPPSLLRSTIRRSFVVGRINLAIAIGTSLLWGSLLSLAPGATFSMLFPLLLPVFGTVGATGPMLVFTNDRTKGVFEYLMAYGISPHRIFVTVVATAVAMVSVVDGLTLAVGVSLHVAVGYGVPLAFTAAILAYSLPMSFGAAALISAAGMYWTSLASPRQGMNSPLGVLPLVGVAPGGLTLVAAEAAGPVYGLYVAVGAVIFVVAVTVSLLAFERRLLPRESLLSPA